MNNLNLKNIVEKLLDTFLEAGKIAKEISRRGVKITIKADKSPVTDGDLAVDQLLKDKITYLTPDIPIISEETVSIGIENQNKNFWLIDPIDGTKAYIKKKDEYTLNAALIINLKPAVGIIYAPEKDRLFFSYGKYLAFEINNGKKTTLNCKKINTNEIIALANSDNTPSEVLDVYKKYKVRYENIVWKGKIKGRTYKKGTDEIRYKGTMVQFLDSEDETTYEVVSVNNDGQAKLEGKTELVPVEELFDVNNFAIRNPLSILLRKDETDPKDQIGKLPDQVIFGMMIKKSLIYIPLLSKKN